MPFDAVMLSLAVTVVFVGFAVALLGPISERVRRRTTRPRQSDAASKRRSF